MKHTFLIHEFTEFIPAQLREGTLYVSIPYATAAHLCACGCGNKVVTPISPADWQLIFDGDSVSLMPSIGNWAFPCQSHYWIRSGGVRWARPWTAKEIAAGRAEDARDRDDYFASRSAAARPAPAASAPAITRHRRLHVGLAHWLARRTRDRGERAYRD